MNLVEQISIEKVKIAGSDVVLKELSRDIDKTNLLMVGEVHGVRENACFYYTLFVEFGFEIMALEYPVSFKEELEKFLITGIFPSHYSIEHISDGRVNLEYLALLRNLRKDGLLKGLICFDSEVHTSVWNERDLSYSEQFLNNYDSKLRTLVVAGNLHARKDVFTSALENGDQRLWPMGYHVKNRLGDFPVCKVVYHGGSFYNFGPKNFTGKRHISENYLVKASSMWYEMHLKEISSVTVW